MDSNPILPLVTVAYFSRTLCLFILHFPFFIERIKLDNIHGSKLRTLKNYCIVLLLLYISSFYNVQCVHFVLNSRRKRVRERERKRENYIKNMYLYLRAKFNYLFTHNSIFFAYISIYGVLNALESHMIWHKVKQQQKQI